MRWVIILLLSITINCSAQIVQNFSLTNVSTGQYVALDEFSSQQGVAIIFTSTDCPYDNYYVDRIKQLVEGYKSKFIFLLINANSDETMEQMKKFVAQNNLSIPYLWDIEQKVMTALNAHKSPECFLLEPSNGKFMIVYKGAIDDNPQTASSVSKSYLKEALDKSIAREKIDPKDVRPVGCSIR